MSLRHPRDEGERWWQLSLVTFALFVALLIFMAVIPSWWLYFADGTLKWTKFWPNKLRDLIVVIYYGAVVTAAFLAVSAWNRRNPKLLPSGEEKREATGGYK